MEPALPLSPTLQPLVQGDPRVALRLISERGFRHVQLSAAMPGLRPRDLDRSARRDLLARLRRDELELSGLDLWVPEEHFLSPHHADRAMAAVLETVQLAADLGRVPVSVRLPEGLDESMIDAFRAQSDRCSTPIADHGAFAETLGAGIDPADVLAANSDPAALASRVEGLVSARFSDSVRGGRVVPGQGRLDILNYQAALLTRGHRRPIVLDLRLVPEPWSSLEAARDSWMASPLAQSASL